MKKQFLLLSVISALTLALTGCSSHELSRSTAFDLLKKEFCSPKVYDWDVFTADPEEAKKILATNLEAQGYAVVMRTQNFHDMGKPWVTLTEKSKAFWLPTPDEDKKNGIQKVRCAELNIVAVTGIKMLVKGKKAIVEYTTTYRNLTPFAILAHLVTNKVDTSKAYFSLYDDGWRIEKKPGLDFLSE